MPWKTELPMEQREKFVILVQSDRYTKKELCKQFGISRKTGHKWLKRYVEEGKRGLDERSRAPKCVANRTEKSVERLIVKEKRLHPTWGPKKLQRVLEIKQGDPVL